MLELEHSAVAGIITICKSVELGVSRAVNTFPFYEAYSLYKSLIGLSPQVSK